MSKSLPGAGTASHRQTGSFFDLEHSNGSAALTVERMRGPDVPAIMAIENRIYPFPWTAGNFRDSLAAGYAGWVLRDVTTVNASMVGYAIVMHVLDEAHLMNFSIAATAQRQGLGRRFLAWLCAQCRHAGAVGMFLEVRPSNLAALTLYQQAGFQQVGLRRKYYPNGADGREDAIVMRKSLDHRGAI